MYKMFFTSNFCTLTDSRFVYHTLLLLLKYVVYNFFEFKIYKRIAVKCIQRIRRSDEPIDLLWYNDFRIEKEGILALYRIRRGGRTPVSQRRPRQVLNIVSRHC